MAVFPISNLLLNFYPLTCRDTVISNSSVSAWRQQSKPHDFHGTLNRTDKLSFSVGLFALECGKTGWNSACFKISQKKRELKSFLVFTFAAGWVQWQLCRFAAFYDECLFITWECRSATGTELWLSQEDPKGLAKGLSKFLVWLLPMHVLLFSADLL